VLSIGKLVAGQERYYEQQVARGRDDYYAGRGEAEGRWMGAGATAWAWRVRSTPMRSGR
jgi:TrwC relaxase